MLPVPSRPVSSPADPVAIPTPRRWNERPVQLGLRQSLEAMLGVLVDEASTAWRGALNQSVAVTAERPVELKSFADLLTPQYRVDTMSVTPLTRAVPPHNAPRALRISESPRLGRRTSYHARSLPIHVHACADVRVQFGTDTSQAERLALERAQRAANYAQECSTRTEGLPHAFALGSTAGSPAPSRRNSIAQPRARAAAR